MSKKHYYLIVDTETTMDEKVADFGAVIVDRKGAIQAQCGILINGIYNDRENHPLFFNEYSGDLWSRKSLDRRWGFIPLRKTPSGLASEECATLRFDSIAVSTPCVGASSAATATTASSTPERTSMAAR